MDSGNKKRRAGEARPHGTRDNLPAPNVNRRQPTMRLSSPNNINSDGAIKLNSQKAASQVVVIIERLISVLSAPEPHPIPTANFPHAKLAFLVTFGAHACPMSLR